MIATSNDQIVCHCLRVTVGQIQEAMEEKGVCTLRDVMRATGAGRGCMSCHARIKAVLAGEAAPSTTFVVPQCGGCSNRACGCGAAPLPHRPDVPQLVPMPQLAAFG